LLRLHDEQTALLEIQEAAFSAISTSLLCTKQEIARVLNHVDTHETEEFAKQIAESGAYTQAREVVDSDLIGPVIAADLSEYVHQAREANGLYALSSTGSPSTATNAATSVPAAEPEEAREEVPVINEENLLDSPGPSVGKWDAEYAAAIFTIQAGDSGDEGSEYVPDDGEEDMDLSEGDGDNDAAPVDNLELSYPAGEDD
jgi:hypothetical protein